MKKITRLSLFVLISSLFFTSQVYTQNELKEHDNLSKSQQSMTNIRLEELIKRVDKNTKGQLGFWSFTIENVEVQVITDATSNRMRIISPILKANNLDEKILYRLMQANFDTVLDARYAIANGILWSTFIHPLKQLSDEDFLVGLGQTVNSVISYGSTYSSGLLSFHGGDSQTILRQDLIETLKKKGRAI